MRILVADRLPDRFAEAMERRGHECVVEAGLYVTAGTRVTMPDGQIVKARELSGASNILFRRNSVTGTVEARPNNAVWGGLNDVLHSHN